ncbi:MAG TPA: 1,4-dihydroxy-6-naphthoate synthase, partial [Chloroflexota bacterium]|nr:1,4-dihydroxy-6-naphthoate synthase [Chloroflexota bacterium]
MEPLTLAYSPCPNDTFIFTPWVEGLLPQAPPVRERLEDIDTLNRLAGEGALDVAKVSFNAFGHLRDRYCLLHAGGALGRGCGPLVVARPDRLTGPAGAAGAAGPAALTGARIAIPGELTTAALLLRLYAPEARDLVVMPFNRIMTATRDGAVDAGLIIHESRFTYPRYGLRQVVDLGEWWEGETGHAIPLGGIVARRDLGADLIQRIDDALAASVGYAHAHPDAVWPTVRRHAQEMEDAVMRQHIDLYVNRFTSDYGPEGEAAIAYLLATAERLGVVPPSARPLFL